MLPRLIIASVWFDDAMAALNNATAFSTSLLRFRQTPRLFLGKNKHEMKAIDEGGFVSRRGAGPCIIVAKVAQSLPDLHDTGQPRVRPTITPTLDNTRQIVRGDGGVAVAAEGLGEQCRWGIRLRPAKR